jgi:predicted NUDIX family phosphoesterase
MTEKELMEKYGDERVLVVEARNFLEKDTPEDYFQKIDYYGVFAPRWAVELNESERQIIPYVVLKCKDKYFVTKRLGGDDRLVGGYSLGQGGHINPEDRFMAEGRRVSAEGTVKECIYRELSEETTLDIQPDVEFVDVFIDDNTDVSKVHACILCVMEIPEEIEIKEKDKLEGMWVTKEEITPEMFDGFENWSKIVYKKLFNLSKPKTPKKTKSKGDVE